MRFHWEAPKEKWSGKSNRINNLRVFGSSAEVFVPGDLQNQSDEISHQCMCLGYTETWQNYRFIDIESGRVVMSGTEKFYKLDTVRETSTEHSEVSVFYYLLYSDSNESGVGSNPCGCKVKHVPSDGWTTSDNAVYP